MNRQNIRTSKFGFEAVSTVGAILWNNLPPELKNAESFGTEMIVPVTYIENNM